MIMYHLHQEFLILQFVQIGCSNDHQDVEKLEIKQNLVLFQHETLFEIVCLDKPK